VRLASTKIKKFRRKVSFDAIAFTGTSGAAIAYLLSFILKIPLICIRKSIRDNHSGLKLEGCITAKKYIIVDDFIESGRTINKIKKSITAENKKSKCVGIYLYNNWRGSEPFNGVPII
jgi:adenine/guanine phosphoribosyltransferase-like PRPP-binding protein